MVIEVRESPADVAPGSELLAAMVAELREMYGDAIIGATPSATPADFSPPGGGFVVVYADGVPVACGGIKQLAPDCAEIKRMYVAPNARSQGVARRLLTGLEDLARSRGYPRVRLDTGPSQPHARALYESAGYRSIENYNDNAAAAYWGEKEL